MILNIRFIKILILLIIECIGSIWLFDVICCYLGIKYWFIGIICKDLKFLKFRCYFMDLFNYKDGMEIIEVLLGKWEKIFNFNKLLIRELDKKIQLIEIYVIEKFYFYFFKFKFIEFIRSIIYLENLGVEVKLIYFVRDF